MTDWNFHHVGIVTADLAGSVAFYTEVAGYSEYLRIVDSVQDATIVLLSKNGSPIVELISPLSSAGPAAGWLKRIKAGPYHTCYEVRQIGEVLKSLKELGLQLVFGPNPAVAFGGSVVAFVWGPQTGLMELLETAPVKPN